MSTSAHIFAFIYSFFLFLFFFHQSTQSINYETLAKRISDRRNLTMNNRMKYLHNKDFFFYWKDNPKVTLVAFTSVTPTQIMKQGWSLYWFKLYEFQNKRTIIKNQTNIYGVRMAFSVRDGFATITSRKITP